MANQTVYVVTNDKGTETFTRVGDVAKYLGTKVTKKGIMAGEYPEVTLAEEMPPTKEFVDLIDQAHKEEMARQEQKQHEKEYLAELDEEDEDTQDSQEEDTPELTDTHEEDTEEPTEEEEVVEDSPEPVDSGKEYPEVGEFSDEKSIKKFIKGLTNDELSEWVDIEGVEYKSNDNPAINRMRQAMAIKALHFPNTAPKAKKKSKSKYSDYTTEQLVEMAMDNDVEVRDDKGDARILRMYTIMALRQAGILD